MIETVMYVALGFLLASLLALLLAPPLWRRAVRLTTRKLESTMPMSLKDIQADKDQLRAEFAIKFRQLEIALDKAKDKAARHLVERNRAQAGNDELKAELKGLKTTLAERESEITVLEQTVKRKIPDLEAQLGRAREIIMSRDQEIQRLRGTQATQLHAVTPSARRRRDQRADTGKAAEAIRKKAQGRRRRKLSAKDAAELLADNQRLASELARLEQSSTQEREALKSEMKALAEQLMRTMPGAAKTAAGGAAPPRPRPATPGAPAAPGAAPGMPASVRAETKPPLRRVEPTTKKAAAKAAAKPDRKARKSLTDRLKALANSDSK